MKYAVIVPAAVVLWGIGWHFGTRFLRRQRRARDGAHVAGPGRLVPVREPVVRLDEDPLDGWVRTLPQVIREQYLDRAREQDAARVT